MNSEIEALAYVGLEVSDFAAWRAFAEGELGLQGALREDGTIDLRIDPYATRLAEGAGGGGDRSGGVRTKQTQ